MKSKDLLKEAIADANAVRDVALENAKIALEEAFMPRLQSMLRSRLAEADDEEEETEDMPVEDSFSEESYVDDGKDGTPASELDEYTEGDENSEEDEAEDEVAEEDLGLESILRELEAELAGRQVSEEEEDEESMEEGDYSGKKDDDEKSMEEGDYSGKKDDDEDLAKEDIEGYLSEILKELEDPIQEKESEEDLEEGQSELEETKAQLAEAYETIKTLKDKFTELKVLNNKLAYSTKIFKHYDLTESQKVKVLESLDRAITEREIKLVYSTLCENLNKTKGNKKVVKESASRVIKGTRKVNTDIISEGNDVVNRFQFLANIKK